MRAEQSAVSNMVEVEFCEDCPLGQKFKEKPVFATMAGLSASGSGTEIFFSDGENAESEVGVGILRADAVIDAFNNCQEAIVSRRFIFKNTACGALIELKQRRRNGREEI